MSHISWKLWSPFIYQEEQSELGMQIVYANRIVSSSWFQSSWYQLIAKTILIFITFVWLLGLQVDIRCLYCYKIVT